MRPLALLAALAGLAGVGCESTREKSARLEKEGAGALAAEKGLEIGEQARGVSLAERVVLSDANGAAVALVLRNTTGEPLARVPVAIDVRGRAGKSIFRNDEPGLEPSLTSVALLAPRAETVWVHDQAIVEGRARGVEAEVGAPKRDTSGELPEIELTRPKLELDPASGSQATGFATLKSGPEQQELVVYCVARRNGRIVAAGRAIIDRLTDRRRRPFSVFFIGDPRGAELTVSAPPTVL